MVPGQPVVLVEHQSFKGNSDHRDVVLMEQGHDKRTSEEMEPAGASKVFFNHDGLLEVQPSDTIHLSGSVMHIDPVLVDNGGDVVIGQ
ncbi:hypothetical protein V6N11_018251 [Hibiscus sabdariffa]|uniref:Uncharacterized protein n=1 Tax=Hibiscus sabdariffa TaxID=183260 RepID=A0ABR2T7C6_9ROSI